MNHSLEMKKLPLEDLQEKFAAIVQEARNNPCLLEQFMIWLDMKVAEYKAKGVILLEVTGSKPNPRWLRRHKGDLAEENVNVQNPGPVAGKVNNVKTAGTAKQHVRKSASRAEENVDVQNPGPVAEKVNVKTTGTAKQHVGKSASRVEENVNVQNPGPVTEKVNNIKTTGTAKQHVGKSASRSRQPQSPKRVSKVKPVVIPDAPPKNPVPQSLTAINPRIRTRMADVTKGFVPIAMKPPDTNSATKPCMNTATMSPAATVGRKRPIVPQDRVKCNVKVVKLVVQSQPHSPTRAGTVQQKLVFLVKPGQNPPKSDELKKGVKEATPMVKSLNSSGSKTSVSNGNDKSTQDCHQDTVLDSSAGSSSQELHTSNENSSADKDVRDSEATEFSEGEEDMTGSGDQTRNSERTKLSGVGVQPDDPSSTAVEQTPTPGKVPVAEETPTSAIDQTPSPEQPSDISEEEPTSGRSPRRSSRRSPAAFRLDFPDISHMYPRHTIKRLKRAAVRARVEAVVGKPTKKEPGRSRGTIMVLMTLERWLWSKFRERRQVETMPVDHLNKYLEEFFRVVRKESGEPYSPASFGAIQRDLANFLEASSYPYCLKTSEKFKTCRKVYEKRLEHLQKVANYHRKSHALT